MGGGRLREVVARRELTVSHCLLCMFLGYWVTMSSSYQMVEFFTVN